MHFLSWFHHSSKNRTEKKRENISDDSIIEENVACITALLLSGESVTIDLPWELTAQFNVSTADVRIDHRMSGTERFFLYFLNISWMNAAF